MKPALKIGGISDLQDARYCAATGIGLLGFNLGKEKQLLLEPAAVKEMLSWLSGPEGIGEFSYSRPSEISQIALAAGIHRISIPGDYQPEDASQLPLPLLFRVEAENDLKRVSHQADLFPSGLFEIRPELFFSLPTETQKNLLGRTLLIAQTPDPIWRQLKHQGSQPLGFSLGTFVSDSQGHLDYESCDEFLSAYGELVPG